MPRCSVLLKDTTLLRGVEGIQQHGAVWHSSKPWSNMAFFNTTEQRGIIQNHRAA
jgi:hypothetical protein